MLKKFLPLEPLWQLLLGQSAEKQRWTVTVTAARGPECCGFGRARPGASFRAAGMGTPGPCSSGPPEPCGRFPLAPGTHVAAGLPAPLGTAPLWRLTLIPVD